MNKQSILEYIKTDKPFLQKQFGVKEIALFGSYARNENNPDRAFKIAPRMAAERIMKDAQSNLDMPSTKSEQTYLKKLVKVLNDKAKDYYASKKQNIRIIQ